MSVLQAKAMEYINIGAVVCYAFGAAYVADASKLSDVKSAIGLAARNIEKGELIEYRPGENTKDIIAKSEGVEVKG